MTTIANLVVEASVDPTGVKSGLDEAFRNTQEYAAQTKAVHADMHKSMDSVELEHIEHMELSTRTAGRQIAHLSEIAINGTQSLQMMAITAGHVGEEMAHMSGSAAIAASATGIGILGAALGVLVGVTLEAKKALEELPEGKITSQGQAHVAALHTQAEAQMTLNALLDRQKQLVGEVEESENKLEEARKKSGAFGFLGVGIARLFTAGDNNKRVEEAQNTGAQIAAVRAASNRIAIEDQNKTLAHLRVIADAEVDVHTQLSDRIKVIRAEQHLAEIDGSLTVKDAAIRAADQIRTATADAAQKQTQDAAKAWAEYLKPLQAVVEAFATLEHEHVLNNAAGVTLLATYQKISGELATMSDLTTEHAKDLLRLRAAMEQTQMMSAIAGAGAGGTQYADDAVHVLAGAPEDSVKTSAMLVERIGLMRELGQTDTKVYNDAVAALILVNQYLDHQQVTVERTNEGMRQQLANTRALNEENARRFPSLAGVPAGLVDPGIAAQAQRARDALALADAARASGANNAGDLEKAANVERERAVAIIRNMIEQLGTRKDLSATEITALTQMGALMRELTVHLDKHAAGWTAIGIALHGVLDIASGLGKIPQDLRTAITAAEDLYKSIKSINEARKATKETGGIFGSLDNFATALPGMIGVLGAGVSIFQAVFAQNNAALQANTQKLSELAVALQQTKGVQGDQAILGALDKVTPGMTGVNFAQSLTQFQKELQDAGLTIDQAFARAKELGIDITTTGKQGFQQFAQALQLVIQAAGKFSDTLGDQQALRQLRDKVYGNTAPVDQVKASLDMLAQFAPQLGSKLQQIDVTTTAGQQQLRDALKNLVDQISAGTLTPDQLGRLKGVKDLAGLIDGMVTGLDALKNAANSAATSLNNVSWYKVAQAVYAVAPTMTGPNAPAGAPGTTPGSTAGGTPTSVAPPSASDARPYLQINGGLQIMTAETDANKLLDAITRVARTRTQSATGSTRGWGIR